MTTQWREICTNHNLSPREMQIAELMCEGLKPAEIAEKLDISVYTAYKHISNIYKKMSIRSQIELLSTLMLTP